MGGIFRRMICIDLDRIMLAKHFIQRASDYRTILLCLSFREVICMHEEQIWIAIAVWFICVAFVCHMVSRDWMFTLLFLLIISKRKRSVQWINCKQWLFALDSNKIRRIRSSPNNI